jgi:hypothetical protein
VVLLVKPSLLLLLLLLLSNTHWQAPMACWLPRFVGVVANDI